MAGKAVSASFVSCMQTTSGWAYSIHSSTRGRRALSEFTFQVAMRMISSGSGGQGSTMRSVFHDDEEKVDLAGQIPVDRGPTASGAGPRRQTSQAHVEIECLARDHLAPKTRF